VYDESFVRQVVALCATACFAGCMFGVIFSRLAEMIADKLTASIEGWLRVRRSGAAIKKAEEILEGHERHPS